MIPVDTPEIEIDQFAQAVRCGATIIDVREPGEYVADHVPGAGSSRWASCPGFDVYSVAGVTTSGPAQAGPSFSAAPPGREN